MPLLPMAIAGGPVSTFAWFSISSAGTSVQNAAQAITIVDNETTIGSVKFTGVKGSPTIPAALELSDDDGVTKVKVGETTPIKPGVTFFLILMLLYRFR